jgi:hypothetical protein
MELAAVAEPAEGARKEPGSPNVDAVYVTCRVLEKRDGTLLVEWRCDHTGRVACRPRGAARKVAEESILPGDTIYVYGRWAFDAEGGSYLWADFIRRVPGGRRNGARNGGRT